ncbi:rho GTPase-activating protein 23 isoform X3 [Silurus meridionalis]|uniref:rho GTPase-activating protein 23 isoform X3 n=1 Tax=Silurus meridionalis TaxID=175797 RepID=UPI001EEC6D32|nr:rho GTPase-activating protein 23 isoform X3 [Silurus meridionalis]XP_046709357.1 rho GTPase-activating protein 23 isoform X3 [Silurus meridionalis]
MNGVAFCLVGIPPVSESQAKGPRDGVLLSNENACPVSREGVAWKGPRTVVLQKTSQGFGFTLRHFIVYPPESALHTSVKDVDNGNGKGNHRGRMEPMDTIFVKSVKESGPAHQAGLCTGDRLVKVNGESILGKTYSQVIALIQNSKSLLELSIMPKDEDVLQLVSAYSHDAYLKGNQPYTGGAQNLPEPPPICYPRSKPTSSVMPGNLNCRRGSAGLLDSRPMGDSIGGTGRRSDTPGRLCNQRARSSTLAISPLDFHFANHNEAISSASLPHPRKGSLPLSQSELCHQALSKWYYSQTTERPGMSHHHRSISQDTLLCHYGTATGVNQSPYIDSCWMGRWGMTGAQQSNRSCSENLLATCAEYEKSHGHSQEKLDKAASLVSRCYEKSTCASQSSQSVWKEEQPCLANQRAVTCADVLPLDRGSSHAQESAQSRCLPTQTVDDQMVGYRSYSPSFCRKAGHLMQQAHSFRDSSYTGPHLSWTTTPKTSPPDSAPSTGRDSSPLSMSSTAETQSSAKESSGSGPTLEESVQAQMQEVVLRQKLPGGKCTPLGMRHPNYAVPVDLLEPPVALAPGRSNGNLQPLPVEQDSLASIPFIDEPTSPSVDLLAQHVPASSVVSSSLCQAPTLSSSPVPPSLTSPLTHLLDTDCSTVKNSRRSSYLLAITTERSKSCDEGLNTFRDEGRMFMRLPKRVKSFFTEGSLESLRAAEEARSKRHSTSELGNITLTDIRKEGWLHYKQILTEKGKKVGGGMRPWKRVFSVLRSHSLFLYKDKREAVLHGAGSLGHGGGGEDEQPISVRGCLIDIAYSETKRKNTLRLTTQDFCEYLLQAEDRDDMLSWIRIIRENSKTDNEELGFSRQALINKKLNDYKKQSLTGTKPDTSPRVHRMMQPFLLSKTDSSSGVNRSPKAESKEENSPPKATWSINIMKKGKKAGPKAFGVRLEDCPPGATNKFVPLIVETCCSLVEEMGLEYTGIYRVPGNNAMVSTLQDQLNKGMEINTTEERWQDLNVISSLLKSFFRKLPEPLFTDDKYNDFIYANRLEDAGDRLKTMRKLIRDLPDHCYHTLKFVISHLKRVADHSEKNKMEPRNLALVFGPTLVRTSEDNMTDMVTHMPDRYKIVETLILHHAWFFTDELMDKDEKTPEDQRDEQPIPNIDHLLSNIGRTAPLGDASDSTNSDSAKSKGSTISKKDVSAKDFLPLSIISAVTRKRKKHRSACPTDSSSDEDSEHEPVKASNYGELSENGGNERDGGQQDEEDEESKMGCAAQSEESQTKEVDEKDVEGKQMMEPQEEREQEVGGRESGSIQQEDDGIRVSVNMRAQLGQEQPQRPRSFLYSHQSSTGQSVTDQSASSPTSPCSSDAHRLSQVNSASRKKLRGERARPRSLYEEPGLERAAGLARVKASLVRGQERLRQAMSPSRDPSVQPSWLSQVHANFLSSANDLWRSGTQRRHASPETRRRRRDWRRHTVVGNSGEI